MRLLQRARANPKIAMATAASEPKFLEAEPVNEDGLDFPDDVLDEETLAVGAMGEPVATLPELAIGPAVALAKPVEPARLVVLYNFISI